METRKEVITVHSYSASVALVAEGRTPNQQTGDATDALWRVVLTVREFTERLMATATKIVAIVRTAEAALMHAVDRAPAVMTHLCIEAFDNNNKKFVDMFCLHVLRAHPTDERSEALWEVIAHPDRRSRIASVVARLPGGRLLRYLRRAVYFGMVNIYRETDPHWWDRRVSLDDGEHDPNHDEMIPLEVSDPQASRMFAAVEESLDLERAFATAPLTDTDLKFNTVLRMLAGLDSYSDAKAARHLVLTKAAARKQRLRLQKHLGGALVLRPRPC